MTNGEIEIFVFDWSVKIPSPVTKIENQILSALILGSRKTNLLEPKMRESSFISS